MKYLDTLFMLVGVGYTCYVLTAILLKLDYQVRRRRRRGKCVWQQPDSLP